MGKENIIRPIASAKTAVLLCAVLPLTLLPVGQRVGQDHVEALWIVLWGSMVALAALIYQKRCIHWNSADAVVGICMLWYFCRAYFDRSYPNATILLRAATFVCLYAFFRLYFAAAKMPWQSLVLTLIVWACIEAVWGLYQLATGSSRHAVFPITGNFLNPGPYSASLMTGLAVATTWPVFRKGRYWHPVALLLLAVLIGTFSRAAITGLAVTGLIAFRRSYMKYKYAVWISIAFIAIALYFFKQGSANGRLCIWAASITYLLHSPWLGVGIGGFNHACGEGMTMLYGMYPQSFLFQSAGVADNAYNFLINTVVEQGIIGLTMFVVMAVILMRRLYKQSYALFYGMLSLLVFAMFSYPFDCLPFQVIAAMVFAWGNAQPSRECTGNCRPAQMVVTFVTTGIVCLMAWMTKSQIHSRVTADKDFGQYADMSNSTFLKDYYELLSFEEDHPQFLFSFAQCLRQAHRYRDSNAMLRLGTLSSADPMFYILMGNNYTDEGFYAEAAQAYQHAFAMMPNRIYPLFKLMTLYQTTAQHQREVAMAQRIIAFHEKIPSPATRQIKQKALEILKKHKDKQGK